MSHRISEIVKDFIKEHKFQFSLYFIFLLSFPISDIVLPHFYGKVMDDVSNTENVKSNVKIIVALLSLNLILETLTNHLDASFKPKLKSYIRTKLVENILEKFKECYKEQEVGDLIAKIIKLPAIISDLVHQLKDYIFPMILIFSFAIGYFFKLHKNLGLLFLCGTIFFLSFIYIFIQPCIQKAMKMDILSDNVHEEIGDMLENLSSIYSSCASVKEVERIEKYQYKLDEAYKETIHASSNFNTVFTLLYMTMFGGFLYYSFQLNKQGELKTSELLSIIIVSLYIISNLKSATSEIRDFIFNIGVLNKSQSFLDELFEIYNKSKSSGKDLIVNEGKIEIKDVWLTYPHSEEFLFKGLNLTIHPGEVIGVIGKIGSGKSSFVKMLLKYHKYSKGQIFIDGQEIKEVDPDILRSKIAYMGQRQKVFNRTLYENIVYGNERSSSVERGYLRDRVNHLIDSLGIQRLFGTLKLDDSVGKGGQKLSGGQQRIVMLLRAMISNAKIFILDEPSNDLNPEIKNKMMEMINDLAKNKTVIIISHDKDLFDHIRFSRIIKFENGKILN